MNNINQKHINMGEGSLIEKLDKERKDLSEKVSKLNIFLKSSKVKDIPKVQHNLLILQESVMTTYLECLTLRIDNLVE